MLRRRPLRLPLKGALYLLYALMLGGCVSMATDRLAQNLSQAMLNQSDPEVVRQGAPAYLLLIDAVIADSPDDPAQLVAGAELYGAYAGGLVTDPVRRRSLTEQAMAYASRAFCPRHPLICEARNQPFDRFSTAVAEMNTGNPQLLYSYSSNWAAWIQARQDDWNAVADLPKVELLLQRLVDDQPGFAQGRAQLYLAVMRTLLPASLGGKPELGRQHFELAIQYSQGRDLMAKVEYARRYARLVFDQALHQRLLEEVLGSDPKHPGLTLSNVLAQQQAAMLLQDEYFE